MPTILIIDDDRSLNELLKTYLGQFGMQVLTAVRPDEGLMLLRTKAPSLIILDIMLPDQDGFSLCREIRKESSVPIIMLTARGELADRVAGLELGADDYLPKPFEPRELVARMQSLLRRAGMDASVRRVQNKSKLMLSRLIFVGEEHGCTGPNLISPPRSLKSSHSFCIVPAPCLRETRSWIRSAASTGKRITVRLMSL